MDLGKNIKKRTRGHMWLYRCGDKPPLYQLFSEGLRNYGLCEFSVRYSRWPMRFTLHMHDFYGEKSDENSSYIST